MIVTESNDFVGIQRSVRENKYLLEVVENMAYDRMRTIAVYLTLDDLLRIRDQINELLQ